MNGLTTLESDYSEFVETDPTGRYGRYKEVLGKGASKTVYRAFDEYEGIEVAWNQVKLNDFLQTPEDLERLYSEIHLLKTLKHKNIMKFYSSWVDTSKRNINFVTELFTSGTLRQYRQKHKRVNIRAVKHWCRQILTGLLYLHSLDPPVIHRDLKCDNIFINGNQGEVKIGDLGLAAILRKSHAAHCVGTPEFMAPEVYNEEYNELVDIYSFGMCILEMVTFDYPYSECTHPAQIYKKVISGKKPDALYKVKDPEVRRFVDKCLATVSLRLPARELLNDPFLQIDGQEADLKALESSSKLEIKEPIRRQPLLQHQRSNSLINRFYSEQSMAVGLEPEKDCRNQSEDIKDNGIELFTFSDDELSPNVDITIKGKRNDDNEIILRLRIADKEGRIRNIYFPFDIESDTALTVATEMVEELEFTDQDVTMIADMIDGEITLLVPEWQVGLGIEETPRCSNATYCQNCASSRPSNASPMNHVSLNSPRAKNLPVLPCLKHECASTRGRFEEITYQVEESEHRVTDDAPAFSSQSDEITYADEWAQNKGHELSSEGSGELDFDEKKQFHQFLYAKDECVIDDSVILTTDSIHLEDDYIETLPGHHPSPVTPSSSCSAEDDYENEIRQELRWMKARYQMELQDHLNGRLGSNSSGPNWSPDSNSARLKTESRATCSLLSASLHEEKDKLLLKSFGVGKHISCYFAPIDNTCPKPETPRARHCEARFEALSQEQICFFASPSIPHSLRRTTSLPVDAVDV